MNTLIEGVGMLVMGAAVVCALFGLVHKDVCILLFSIFMVLEAIWLHIV